MFSIDVRYRFGEYLSFLAELLPAMKEARWRGVEPHALHGTRLRLPWRERPAVWLAGLVTYFHKDRKLGRCTFTVDEAGLRRESRLGTRSVEWKDVPCVYELSRAYLVAVQGGTMPIPYRVLGAEQRAELRSLLERNGVKVVRFGP